MKKILKKYIPATFTIGILLLLSTGCNKEEDPADPVVDPKVPVVSTTKVYDITYGQASLEGIISNDGGAVITQSGICWALKPLPTIEDNKILLSGRGDGSLTGTISGLSSGRTYYARAFATNKAGTGYGNELSFETFNEKVADIDGNIYNTVTIGTQVWMVENLKTTRYRDGTSIENVTDPLQWNNIHSGAYSDYNNLEVKGSEYGHLYNWFAATDSRNIAPYGWHVPSKEDFEILSSYLGGDKVAGGKLKETGYEHWMSPNMGATNESGFTAIPGGARNLQGFALMGEKSGWWTTEDVSEGGALIRYVAYYEAGLNSHVSGKFFGNSIRCVKD